MTDPVPSGSARSELLRREIEDLLVHIEGLVRVRDILRQRGAGERELEEHSAEIGRLQWRLSQRVRETVRTTRVRPEPAPADSPAISPVRPRGGARTVESRFTTEGG